MASIPNENRPSISGNYYDQDMPDFGSRIDTPMYNGWMEETYRTQQNAIDEYKTRSGEFDIRKFNKEFEQKLAKQRIKRIEYEQSKLHAPELIEPKKIHELSLAEILSRVVNVIFDILTDFFTYGLKVEYLTKDDRLLYVGLCVLFIIIIYNSLSYIFLA